MLLSVPLMLGNVQLSSWYKMWMMTPVSCLDADDVIVTVGWVLVNLPLSSCPQGK